MQKLLNDTAHWQNLKPPLCPNEQEISIYENLVKQRGPVCLLGMTRQLIHICDYMVDLNPIPQEKPVIKSDWVEFKMLADAIIGDGIINLSGIDLVPKIMEKCELFVCRVFLEKMDGMKYATYFPKQFPKSSRIIYTHPQIAIVTWGA